MAYAIQHNLTFNPSITSGFRDPAFGKNKERPLHRWVPWVAGFSADFVADCLTRYLPPRPRRHTWLLDPFAGVGTTLVEGFIHGLNVIGFEINPYAALAARLKLQSSRVSLVQLEDWIEEFESFMRRRCAERITDKAEPKSKPPVGFSGRTQLFSSRVERKVLFALDFVASIRQPLIRDIFRLALGSVMVSASNYSYEPSLTRRSAVNKPAIKDADIGTMVALKLRLMLDDIEWLQRHLNYLGRRPQATVMAKSIFSALPILKKANFIDLIVTSPPYLNNYHYPRNTRPQLHWLGFNSGPGYNGAGELESFGKFWQTVRNQPPVALSFPFRGLQKTIDGISGLNFERGSYGGAGWANYVATYFNDTHRFCSLLFRLLRPRAYCVVVLGNSIIQGAEVKTDKFFGEIAELCGLKYEDNILLRKKRTGSSIIRSSVRVDKAANATVLYESAIVLRKK